MLDQNGRYCLYLRKSRTDSENYLSNTEELLCRHEKLLLELADNLHIRITKVFREIVSGDSISARPFMQQLLHEVECHLWDGVCVVEIERLARGDTIDQGIVARTFQLSSTKIITPLRIYDPDNNADEEYFEFGLFMSRREYKTIQRRLSAGRLSSVKEGKYIGSVPPFGYSRQKLPHEKGFTLIPNPKQAPIVRLIFDWYVNGYSGEACGTTKIADYLNSFNIPSGHEQKWSADSVRCILTNPVYIGKIRWNARKIVKSVKNNEIIIHRPLSSQVLIIDGLHEPLITEALFDAAQTVRRQRHHLSISCNHSIQNPMAGLIYCSCCHRKMIRKPRKSTSDLLVCPTTGCSTIGSSLEHVENRIFFTLISFYQNTLLPISVQNKKDMSSPLSQNQLVTIKEKEFFDLELRQKRIFELLEQGVYSIETYRQRQEELSSRKADCASILDALRKDTSFRTSKMDLPSIYEATHAPISLSDIFKNIYPTWPPQKKNQFLKLLLYKIDYSKDEKYNPSVNSEDTFSIHLYPKII